MAVQKRWPTTWEICLAIGLLICALAGCKSRMASGDERSRGAQATNAGPAAHIDLLCVADRINSPSESFHYSYKYSDDSNSIDNEADITPQRIDITATDKSGTHTYHGVRSDEASWNAAVLDLSSLRFTAMTSRIDSLNGTSSVTSMGAESINGYSTTKYSIDTARASSADRKQFETLFGSGSFEKGTAWVPADGCAVKLHLDEAVVKANGAVTKGHYEMSLSKN